VTQAFKVQPASKHTGLNLARPLRPLSPHVEPEPAFRISITRTKANPPYLLPFLAWAHHTGALQETP